VGGLAVARVLGGIGTFMAASQRSAVDWIGASWCAALLFALVGWWIAGWQAFGALEEVGAAILAPWVVSTSFLYLAAYALVPSTEPRRDRGPGGDLFPLRPHFYLCLGAHFGVAVPLTLLVAPEAQRSSVASIVVVMMIPISAAGALVEGNRARVLHLLIWGATMLLLVGGASPRMGSGGP
jgi:hypothetical protein